MATRARTKAEERLARRLAPLYEHSGLSYRDLEELVKDALGPAHAVSHEHIRKLHAGILGWGNVHVEVVKALAAIYGRTLRQLSPELADIDELRRFKRPSISASRPVSSRSAASTTRRETHQKLLDPTTQSVHSHEKRAA